MKEKVHLDAEQQSYLSAYVRRGKHSARSIRRAQMLLLLQEGHSYEQVAHKVGCALSSVSYLVNRYREVNGDVKKALTERPRPGQPPVVNQKVEAYITALACSKAPDGRSEWTL
ncbi:MAG: helix-turn-helix domain-containing protein, partial [Flavisolibacter sp.]|nr:helix-turn-helix domain-containing protein [Flavisolibacter sp.]